jgi:hypothetical protein
MIIWSDVTLGWRQTYRSVAILGTQFVTLWQCDRPCLAWISDPYLCSLLDVHSCSETPRPVRSMTYLCVAGKVQWLTFLFVICLDDTSVRTR